MIEAEYPILMHEGDWGREAEEEISVRHIMCLQDSSK